MHSPNTLNVAKVRTQSKIEILTLYPGFDGMAQKNISRYCPFKFETVEILVNIGVKSAELKCIIFIIHIQGTSYLRYWNVYQEEPFKKVTNSRLYVLLLLNDERNTLFSSFILRLSSWSVSIRSHYILLGLHDTPKITY
jgi:hypothetical protein